MPFCVGLPLRRQLSIGMFQSVLLLQWNFRVLNGQRHVLLREVEHVEYAVLRATVLAVVDCAHHLHDGFALMYHLCLAVKPDDLEQFGGKITKKVRTHKNTDK